MKRFVLAGLAMAAWGPAARAQEPNLSWNYVGVAGNATVGWALKTPAAQGTLPHYIIAADDRTPGKLHNAQVATLEVDCAAKTVKPVALETYDGMFVKTGTRSATGGHAPFQGQLAQAMTDLCAGASRETFQGSAVQALAWLDERHPAKTPTAPTGLLSFELAGTGSDMEGQHTWLETTSIKRDGDKATAWVFETWPNGWAVSNGRYSIPAPMTWRRYDIQCGAKASIANTWFEQLSPTLASIKSQYVNSSNFSADATYKQIILRVCNNRQMLFSKVFQGDVKALVSANYSGAAQAVQSTSTIRPDPQPQRVDLGPTIRITEKDGGNTYVSTFTRDGAGSNSYKGSTSLAGAGNPFNSTIHVRGLSNGMLILDRVGVITGQWAIPVAGGKASGEGIAYWRRDDDSYSWTLDEPDAITVMTPATPTPAPAPAAFQLPAVVKFREASTKPGEGVYEATWTRRGASSIYDGAWTYLPNGQKFSDVLEVRGVENSKLIVYRQGNGGTYAIPISNGKPQRGTASWVSDPAFYVEFVLN